MNVVRFFTLTFLLCALGLGVNAQVKKGYKYLKKQRYEEAINAFESDIFNKKENVAVEAEYNLAKIYFNEKFDGYDLEKAYGYAKSALDRQTRLKGEALKKAQKKGLGKLMLENYKRQIVNAAYNKAKAQNTYASYQHFLNHFDGPPPIQFEKATIWRNQRGLEEMKKINTFKSYENFRNRYLEDLKSYTPETDSLLQMYLFESFINENGWNQYDRFASKYPENVYVKDSAAAANFRPIANSKRTSDFKDFIIGYPNSIFADLAVRKIYKLTMHTDRLGDYDYFVRHYPNFDKIDELWDRYLKLYLEQKGAGAASEFKQNYPKAPQSILNKLK